MWSHNQKRDVVPQRKSLSLSLSQNQQGLSLARRKYGRSNSTLWMNSGNVLLATKSHTGFNTCQNIDEYLQKSKMAECNTWGSNIELLCFAHLYKVCVFSYSTESSNWDRYGPNNVDRTITVDVTAKSIYLFHPSGHYDVVDPL